MKVIFQSMIFAAMLSPAIAQTVTTTRTEVVTVEAKPTDVLSRNIVGLSIINGQNETVGEIHDVLISQGTVGGYIVSVGGFLGVGERYVVVPPAAVQIAYSENDKKWSAKMDIVRSALRETTPFKYEGRWER